MNLRFLSALTLAAVVFCGAAAAQADKPVRGGTIVYSNVYGEPPTYDCHASPSPSSISRLAPHYSTLLAIDGDKYPQVKGDLAQSWTISPDGTVYTFKLRPNVRFHDGSPLTSHDVKVSLDRVWSPPAGVVSVRRQLYSDIRAVEAPDPSTVVVRLSAPNAAMLSLLAVPYNCVYSAKLLGEDPSYPAKRVMGSGPFKFVRHNPGQDWVGERFDGYFRAGLPYADGFRALNVTPPAAITALASGQVMFSTRGQTREEAARVIAARGDKVRVIGVDKRQPIMMLAAINTERAPLNDPRVRKALLLAMDRWGASAAVERTASLARVGGLVKPGSTFARSDTELERMPGYSRDIEASRKEARRLLAEAGHPNLKINFVNIRQLTFVGVVIADQLRQIGVTVDHIQLEPPQVFARRAAGDYDLVLSNPAEFLDDPTVQLGNYVSFKGNPSNHSRVNDPKVDEMYDAQKRELDPARRKGKVQALEEYLLQQAYVLPFYWNSDYRRTVSAELVGLDNVSSNFVKLDLADLWLRNGGRGN